MVNEEKKLKFKKKGFTLVELLIVVGLLGVSLTLTTGILLSVIKTTRKQEILRNIERNGDAVIRQIEENVRKASSVTTDAGGRLVVQVPRSDGTIITRYFGAVSSATDCDENYIYLTEDLNESDELGNRLTNTLGQGIKVNGFTTNVFSNERPTQLYVQLTLESCYDSSVSKDFQTFITARGTYY